MRKEKEEFRRAVGQIQNIVRDLQGPHNLKGTNSIRQIERFTGELRRKVSALKHRNEELQRRFSGAMALVHEANSSLVRAEQIPDQQRRACERAVRQMADLENRFRVILAAGNGPTDAGATEPLATLID